MTAPILHIAQDPPPLCVREDGEVVSRPSGARYDYFMAWYLRGDSPQELLEAMPELTLGEVHRLIAYYHQHKAEVDAWLAEVEREEENVLQWADEHFPQDPGLLDRLRQRMAEMRAASTD